MSAAEEGVGVFFLMRQSGVRLVVLEGVSRRGG